MQKCDEVDAHNAGIRHDGDRKRAHMIDCMTKEAVKIMKRGRSFTIEFKPRFIDKLKQSFKVWNDKRKDIWRPHSRNVNGRLEYVD